LIASARRRVVFWVHLNDALATHRRRRQARVAGQALLQIDDHLLRDIGLRRSDIRAATYGLPVQGLLSENLRSDATKA
jgi:uncharacterized protein YjiS (DUF1127 family)